MKRPYAVLCVLLGVCFFSCGGKKGEDQEHRHGISAEEGDWKEMDEFHMIMAETFHPYKDSANLEPARTRASELAAAADQWASAPLPPRMDNEQIKTKLQALRLQAEALAERARTEDDDAVGEQLTKVHDTFHELQEAWYAGH